MSDASTLLRVSTGPISLDEVNDFLGAEPTHGAQLLFTGRVRNRNHGRDVIAVQYDLFEPLVLKTFAEIVAEARSRFSEDLRSVIIHRKGRLLVGDASVAIGVSTRHRGEAYEASRHLIEALKHRAPIWKKEEYTDGESDWLEGHSLCQGH